MTKKTNPRLEAFLTSLNDALQDPVVAWFDKARAASEVKYKSPLLRQSFLVGAIPEVFDLDAFRYESMKSPAIYNQKVAGAEWRKKNVPPSWDCWFREFYFIKEDGRAVRYRLPLDRKTICDFANRVIARRKSFE